jgi:S-DNA-T family DNA segregation ATPase FtsK/SpoIIIE
MRVYRANAPRKKKRGAAPVAALALRWTAFSVAALFLACALYLPGASGSMGLWVHDRLRGIFGLCATLLPPLALLALLWRWKTRERGGMLTLGLGGFLLVLSACALLGELGDLLSRPHWGGSLGAAASGWLRSAFGRAGSGLISLASSLLGLHVLTGVSWWRTLAGALRVLEADYRGWTESRRDLREMLSRPRPDPPPGGGMVPPPRSALAAPPEPALPAPPAPPPPAPEAPAPKSKLPGRSPERSSATGSFRLPSFALLQAKRPGSSTGRPSDEEIRESVEQLDKTLSSFDIAARVSGICPGPVITRYEVSPDAGVTVASIVARCDDIALSMKARALRMIAPIPGKAAIGIEIPNRSPAMVTLRDVLESQALGSHPSPLAFALGLSSDGEPLAADLASMPHLLVAGATNSGKSVFVHSLITSILFRRRPDEVKLLLIDPKRIELSLYDGIPHLYDPKVAAKDVCVVTDAKGAAKSLKALVGVMERRYDRFKEFRAQNIAAFNEEARRRGAPEEFYIVVVIDELADLMVVAGDVVEDAVQRLTQMARAVGIHIVLATQRPSVDVITGVIKANLPSRVAMRVASKVDSKVILDSIGAEALLGKGDMLFLVPGSDLQRIQGCFVSTRELGAVVDDLRSKGAPDYPTPEAAGPIGEADLAQFNVDALELTQALKLVLERRRVSQDLLKSQFGSSARATNLLSLLEIKGFIFKPEGSNRWEIQFDKIEDYLREKFPQVKLDKKYMGEN